jgi:hypothetical protein
MSLATAVTALETRRDAVAAELAALTVDGPDFTLDGVTMSAVEYAKFLTEELERLVKLIEKLGVGPCVVYTQGR